MNIEQQLQQLIEQAPEYGIPTEDMQMLAPVFKSMAARLQCSQYYILQNLSQSWVITTLKHRTQTNLSKNVIYAYPSLEALKAATATLDPQVVAFPVPTIQILFQLLAMEPVDSIIFFDGIPTSNPGLKQEISRQSLRAAIGERIRSGRVNLPPDIA